MIFSKEDQSVATYLRALKFIRQNPDCERGEIKDSLGISYPTVTKILNTLTEKGLINSKENIYLQNTAMYFWGISFGATQTKVCLLDFAFEKIHIQEYGEFFSNEKNMLNNVLGSSDRMFLDYCICFPTPSKYTDFVVLMNEVLHSIRKFCENKNETHPVRGIGISFSGAVDKEHRILKESNNIQYLKDVLLDQIIRPATLTFFKDSEIPIVYDHNAKAAAVAEKEYLYIKKNDLQGNIGLVEKKRNIACLYLGTGIGAGFILDNKLYTGSYNFSGEICHLPIYFNAPRDDNSNEFYDFYTQMPICTCGSNRCLECYIRLLDRFLSFITDDDGKFSEEIATENLNNSDLLKLVDKWKKSSDVNEHHSNIQLLREKCKIAYEKLAQLIGYTIISLANTLNIDLFICTGRLTKYYDEIEDRIRDVIATNGLSYIRNSCIIMKSENGKLAPAIGSAIEAAFSYLEDELAWDI